MSAKNSKDSTFVIRQKIRALLEGKNANGRILVYDCKMNKNQSKESRTLLSEQEFCDVSNIGDIMIEVIYSQKQVRK